MPFVHARLRCPRQLIRAGLQCQDTGNPLQLQAGQTTFTRRLPLQAAYVQHYTRTYLHQLLLSCLPLPSTHIIALARSPLNNILSSIIASISKTLIPALPHHHSTKRATAKQDVATMPSVLSRANEVFAMPPPDMAAKGYQL